MMQKRWVCGLLIGIAPAFSLPPKQVPPQHDEAFTLNRTIPVEYSYYNNSYSPSEPLVYEYEEVEKLRTRVLARETNYYGDTDIQLYAALERYRPFVEGKRVAIMGSAEPWYEAVVLAYGGLPVTIEYNKIIPRHPDIIAITPDEYYAHPEQFDCVLSISSYEHDGLGRYGDPINPSGDLAAMEKTKSMLTAGGILILAVPIGRDMLVWNAHRIYGKLRLPLLLNRWKTIDTFGFHDSDLDRTGFEQPIFVLQVDQ